jgi:hypothetical protein
MKKSRARVPEKKPSVMQVRNLWGMENSVIHIERAVRFMMTDFSDRSMWMPEFSVAHMFGPASRLAFVAVFTVYWTQCVSYSTGMSMTTLNKEKGVPMQGFA